VERINAILDDNRENLKTAIANAKGVTEKADEGAAEILADFKAFAEKLKEIADKNGEDIRATIARARAFMEKTDKDADEIRANVKTTSADLKKAVEDFRVVAADAKALLATNRGNLDATLQNFREPIRIRLSHARRLQVNCLRCHQDMTDEIGAEADCVHCHAGVGHGPMR
jgi:ABC-type transporter Mla subunit MlaD